MKVVHIRSFSGPYSVRMLENTDQKTSKYGHLTQCLSLIIMIVTDLGINKKFWLRKKYQNCYFCRKTKSTSFFSIRENSLNNSVHFWQFFSASCCFKNVSPEKLGSGPMVWLLGLSTHCLDSGHLDPGNSSFFVISTFLLLSFSV